MSPVVIQLGIGRVRLLGPLLAHIVPLHELKKSLLPSDIWVGEPQLIPLATYLPIGKNLTPRSPASLYGMQ